MSGKGLVLFVGPKATRISHAEAERLERRVAVKIRDITDLPLLMEGSRRFAALDQYLAGQEAQAAIRGSWRRIEAQIGVALGEGKRGGTTKGRRLNSVMVELSKDERTAFRKLARCFELEAEDTEWDWRLSRRALLAVVAKAKKPAQERAKSTLKPRAELMDEREHLLELIRDMRDWIEEHRMDIGGKLEETAGVLLTRAAAALMGELGAVEPAQAD